ncbi:MAG: nucleoside diphosphate kinase regulator [Proteobacteria bacterium]|nr:nucleoside diphosphate kinase regulator [Pseudomonadota bacterium]MBS0546840.1 nucleoside diphosphate kinase regulator [Pseudomonadota bacterium]
MREDQTKRPLPPIVVSESDHERLTGLATAALDRLPDTARELLDEMERAEIVDGPAMPANVVQMGSSVTFKSDRADKRRITLVYPADEDIARSKVSIMTPIGAALIGLAEGQSIEWSARDGKRHALTVLKVERPI